MVNVPDSVSSPVTAMYTAESSRLYSDPAHTVCHTPKLATM